MTQGDIKLLVIVVVGVIVAHFIAAKVPFLNSYESYEAYPLS